MSTPRPTTYMQIVLAERPGKGGIIDKTFRREIVPFNLEPGPKQVLFKTHFLSMDPTQRTWINDARGYMKPVAIGEVMRSGGIGVVMSVGEGSAFKPGDAVFGMLGWREYGVIDDSELEIVEIPDGATLLDFLGPLGITGLTAYFGVNEVGKLKAGETLVVSGAAGATGSVVCQIGKRIGAKVIAIAGSQDKCEWLEKEIGVDKALNYKSPTFKEEFIESVGYLDVFFDNVGGEILNLALTRLNLHARVVMCGSISGYNEQSSGLTTYSNLIITRSSIQGFLIFEFAAQYNDARKEITKWLQDGSFKRQFHVVDGIEKCPETLPLLFSGGNKGKLVVKVADMQARL